MTAVWRNKFMLLIAAILLIPITTDAKVYLVSVGISDYPGTGNDLTLPVNDARTIAWVYSKNSSLKYQILLDKNATLEKIKNTMNKIFALADLDDQVVFFYSGHGCDGGFYVYDGVLSYQEIRESMSRSKCRNKMIFADTCFSGGLRTDNTLLHTETSAAKKANVMLFLSSRNDEYSLEYFNMKNGLFTNYLQKGIRGGADADKNRIITARELFEYVHTNVERHSEGKQHPVMWGKFPHSMPVMIWK